MPGLWGALARRVIRLGGGDRWIDGVAAALSLGIFAADLLISNGMSVIVLLILVILLSSRSASPRRVVVWTLVCFGLNFTSYFLRHGLTVVPSYIIRRILYDVIFGTSMLVALRHQRLERQRHLLAELLNVAGSVVFRVDLTGTIASWSRGAAQLYGWSEQDVVGRPVADVLRGPDDAHETLLALALSKDSGWEGERRYMTRAGTEVYVYCNLVAQRDHAGRVLAILESHTDLTDIRRTILLTERAEAHYRHLYNMTPAAILEQDHSANEVLAAQLHQQAAGDIRHYLHEHPDLTKQALQNVRLIDCNDAALVLFQLNNKSEMLATLAMESMLLTIDSFIIQFAAFADCMPYCQTEAAVRTVNGETRYVLMATTFPTDALDQRRALVSMIDITEEKLKQKELLNARDELSRVMRMATLGELTSLIAHEVEQPLAASVSASQNCVTLLGASTLDVPKINLLANRVVEAAGNAANSVSRVRQFLRKSVDREDSFEINTSIHAAIAVIQHEFTANGVSVSVACPNDLPRIVGDQAALDYVIMHLLLNGVRASEQIAWDSRKLKIIVTRDLKWIYCAIRDYGESPAHNAPESRFDRLFHEMTVDGVADRGMYMCRANIAALGGRLEILPAAPAGTIIQVVLPIQDEIQDS